jgi:hypothetical protein
MSMRPERASLLSSYPSSPVVGRCLHLWPIFSYVTSCFGFWLTGSVSASFQSTSAFSTSGFLPHLLVCFFYLFYSLKDWSAPSYSLCWAVVGHYACLLRGLVVNCS